MRLWLPAASSCSHATRSSSDTGCRSGSLRGSSASPTADATAATRRAAGVLPEEEGTGSGGAASALLQPCCCAAFLRKVLCMRFITPRRSCSTLRLASSGVSGGRALPAAAAAAAAAVAALGASAIPPEKAVACKNSTAADSCSLASGTPTSAAASLYPAWMVAGVSTSSGQPCKSASRVCRSCTGLQLQFLDHAGGPWTRTPIYSTIGIAPHLRQREVVWRPQALRDGLLPGLQAIARQFCAESTRHL